MSSVPLPNPEQVNDKSQRNPSIPIRGWLLFFCFTTIIGGPLSMLRMLVKLHQPLNIAAYLGLISLSLIVGLLAWFRSELVFPALWLESVARITQSVMVFFAGHRLAGRGVAQGTSAELGAVYGSIVIITWLVYFKRSERVLRTFGRNL